MSSLNLTDLFRQWDLCQGEVHALDHAEVTLANEEEFRFRIVIWDGDQNCQLDHAVSMDEIVHAKFDLLHHVFCELYHNGRKEVFG